MEGANFGHAAEYPRWDLKVPTRRRLIAISSILSSNPSKGGPETTGAPPVVSIDFERISANQIFARNQNDMLTPALEACGATKVTTRDFRMLGGGRELQVSLRTKDFEVRALPARYIIGALQSGSGTSLAHSHAPGPLCE